MSHAAYYFLLSLDDEFDSAHAKAENELTGEDFIDEATGLFGNYAEDVCDENNWSTLLCLVMRDGRLFRMDKEDGRDSMYNHFRKMRVKNRWRKVWEHAMYAVVTDLELEKRPSFDIGEREKKDKVDRMSFRKLVQHVDTHARLELSEALLSIKPVMQIRSMENYELYSLEKKANTYLHLLSAKRHFSIPFGSPGLTPYEYRAFDLTNGATPNAVMVADIHT